MDIGTSTVATSSATAVVTGSIACAANTLALAIVAAELNEDGGALTLTGWTALSAPNPPDFQTAGGLHLITQIWYQAFSEAGSASVEASWAKSPLQPDDTPNHMILHLLEVQGAEYTDSVDGETADTNAAGGIPEDAKDAQIAVSREGNLGVFTLLVEDAVANITPPAGVTGTYTTVAATDADSGVWSLHTYAKPLPYATAYQAQATTATGRGVQYVVRHFECDLDLSGAILMGDF